MTSILPIIRISELQRGAKTVLRRIKDYAVVRSHSKDVAVILHPDLGKALLQSDMFRKLLEEVSKEKSSNTGSPVDLSKLDHLIGQVLRELSKK